MRTPYPIAIGALFSDPDAIFYISHNINRVIQEHLERHISNSSWFDKYYREAYWLSLNDSSKPGLWDLSVCGPEISKRNKAVSFSINVPHTSINDDPQKHHRYLQFHERAVGEIFNRLHTVASKPLSDIYKDILGDIDRLLEASLRSPQ